MSKTRTEQQKAVDLEKAKAFEEVASRNAKTAIEHVNKVDEALSARINQLEVALNTAMLEINQLHHKYNLLLTKNFNGGSTAD